MATKSIKFRNEHLHFIVKVLESFKLEGKIAFARRRFLKFVRVALLELEAEQEDLRIKYCDKDSAQNPKIRNDAYVFKAKNRVLLEKDAEKLGQFEVVIDVLPSNEEDIKAVKTVFEDELQKFQKLKDGKYNADEFEYTATIEEIIEALTIKK